jgi:hypothetical protein
LSDSDTLKGVNEEAKDAVAQGQENEFSLEYMSQEILQVRFKEK